MLHQKRKKRFAEQNIEGIIERIRMEVSKTYGQTAGAHFPNGVITTDTVSLRMKIYARMSDVTKAIYETHSSHEENDYRCCYRIADKDGIAEETSRDAKKVMSIKCQLVFEEGLQSTRRTTSVPNVITNTKEPVPPCIEHAQQTALDGSEYSNYEDHKPLKEETASNRKQEDRKYIRQAESHMSRKEPPNGDSRRPFRPARREHRTVNWLGHSQ